MRVYMKKKKVRYEKIHRDSFIDDERNLSIPDGYEYMGIVSETELSAMLKRDNKVLVKGDDGLLYPVDRK